MKHFLKMFTGSFHISQKHLQIVDRKRNTSIAASILTDISKRKKK